MTETEKDRKAISLPGPLWVARTLHEAVGREPTPWAKTEGWASSEEAWSLAHGAVTDAGGTLGDGPNWAEAVVPGAPGHEEVPLRLETDGPSECRNLLTASVAALALFEQRLELFQELIDVFINC